MNNSFKNKKTAVKKSPLNLTATKMLVVLKCFTHVQGTKNFLNESNCKHTCTENALCNSAADKNAKAFGLVTEGNKKNSISAQFRLYKISGKDTWYYRYTLASDTEGDEYQVAAKPPDGIHSARLTPVITTNNNGLASFHNSSEYGDCYLEEIALPEGYSLTPTPIKVSLSGNSLALDFPQPYAITIHNTSLKPYSTQTYASTVPNEASKQSPYAGGNGTASKQNTTRLNISEFNALGHYGQKTKVNPLLWPAPPRTYRNNLIQLGLLYENPC